MAEGQDKTFVEFAQEQDRIIREASKQLFWRVQKEAKAVRELTEQLAKTKAMEAAVRAVNKELKAKFAQASVSAKNDAEVKALKADLAKAKEEIEALKAELAKAKAVTAQAKTTTLGFKRQGFIL